MTCRASASSTCRMVATSRWTMRELRDMGRAEKALGYSLPVAVRQGTDQARDRVFAGLHVDSDTPAAGRIAGHRTDAGDPRPGEDLRCVGAQRVAQVLDGAARRERDGVDRADLQVADGRLERAGRGGVRLVGRDDLDLVAR